VFSATFCLISSPFPLNKVLTDAGDVMFFLSRNLSPADYYEIRVSVGRTPRGLVSPGLDEVDLKFKC